MKPSGSSSSGPETKAYLAQPRERQMTIAEKKANPLKKITAGEDSTKKKSALAQILKKRKQEADAMKSKGRTGKEDPVNRKPNPVIPTNPKKAQAKFGK